LIEMDSNLIAIYYFPSLPPPYCLLIAILHSIFNQLGGGRGGGVSHQFNSENESLCEL
jgi:hypothetical protein